MEKLVKQPWFWIIIGAVIVAGAILYGGSPENIFDRERQEDIAIRVNDAGITYREIDQIIEQMQRFGMQADSESMKEMVVEAAVEQALLAEYIEQRGLEAAQEEKDELLNELMLMYGAANEAEFLEIAGMGSSEEMQDLLDYQVKVDKLIEIYEEDVEITDEDLQNAYDEAMEMAKEGGWEDQIPPFEEIKEDLMLEMVQEEVIPKIEAKLAEMKEEADIEIFVSTDYFAMEEPEEETVPMQPAPPEQEMEITPEDLEEIEDEGLEIEVEEME